MNESTTRPRGSWKLLGLGVLAVLLAGGGYVLLGGTGPHRSMAVPSDDVPTFARTREQAQRFMDADRTITLTAEQEAIRVEALSAIPAPCCSDFSAATCCCGCNLARTIWGLSKTLIVQGAQAAEVREAVQAWTRTLNPSGYAGNACFVGSCERPLTQDACGGMEEAQLIF